MTPEGGGRDLSAPTADGRSGRSPGGSEGCATALYLLPFALLERLDGLLDELLAILQCISSVRVGDGTIPQVSGDLVYAISEKSGDAEHEGFSQGGATLLELEGKSDAHNEEARGACHQVCANFSLHCVVRAHEHQGSNDDTSKEAGSDGCG